MVSVPFPKVRLPAYAFRFALVGLSGIAINQVAFAGLTEVVRVDYLFAAIIATQFSSTWNFVGTERWAFADRPSQLSLWSRFSIFLAINNATLLLRVPLLWFLATVFLIHPLVANLITLACLFVVRYALADGWIWKAAQAPAELPLRPEPAEIPLGVRPIISIAPRRVARHNYDIAGVLSMESDVKLPELEYFRAEPTGWADIRIRVMRVGALPSRRARFRTTRDNLTYLEQLGAAGANFRIRLGNPIEVEVAPLLAKSPHVLYTNVIEALLRFLLVSRGYVLLHSASMIVEGRAVLLSAQTDTGKTSTVIRLVRDHGYEFLSDDMTIIAPDGRAICYPKPMTLSYHTMSSIRGGEIPARQRVILALQSRLHSKSGRSVGRFLGGLNLPIMSVNSIVQFVIPPPKYHISTLLNCEIGQDAPIGHVVLMERGEEMRERVAIDPAVTQLIENTDDAYAFPPFATFAPHIRLDGMDYQSLRKREVELLRAAVSGANLWRLRVPGHEWAEVLPDIFRSTDDEMETSNTVAIPVLTVDDETMRVLKAPSSSAR